MFDLNLDGMFPLDPSDVVLLLDLVLAIVMMVYFAFGKPRTWFRDRLGWVIFNYAVGAVLLLGLIAWGIVFGQKVGEVFRFTVATYLAGALIAKIWAVYRERREGRLASSHVERK